MVREPGVALVVARLPTEIHGVTAEAAVRPRTGSPPVTPVP
ncbi:hypothetical protein [Streptomyces sp. NPDC050388]